MNEGQIALGILLTLFGFGLLFLFMWWAHADGKVEGATEERLKADKELGLPPFWSPAYQHEKKKIKQKIAANITPQFNGPFPTQEHEDFFKKTGRLWPEPGAPVEIPEPFAQELPSGRIEIIYPPMPWRLEIASRAMQGLHSNHGFWRENHVDRAASLSLESADALLKAFNESEAKHEPNIVTFQGVPLEKEKGVCE